MRNHSIAGKKMFSGYGLHQTTEMHEQLPNPLTGNGHSAEYHRKQRRRMWLAILLLVGALGVVLVKDHQFWFSSDEQFAEDDSASAVSADTAKKPLQVRHQAEKPKKERVAAITPATAEEPETSIIENARAAIRPLDVQVVSGNRARIVRAGNNTLQVEIPAYSGAWTSKWASEPRIATAALTTNAAERVRMSVSAGDIPQESASGSYPLLSKQMRVRGAVVLEALVGADGNIEDLRVVSGPAMLASAAREVLRQWRFKPYLQNGQAVETQAKITVNFLISAS